MMTTKSNRHRKTRELFLGFVKKELDIYGWSKPEDFSDRVSDFKKVILLCPNMTKCGGGRKLEYVTDRFEYLESCLAELEDKDWILEEWEFDAMVYECPNYVLPPDANKKHNDYSKLWHAFHEDK